MAFGKFPKRRIELPDAYRKIYFEHYKRNRGGNTPASSLSARMERWLHRRVSEDVKHSVNTCTLEIGGGTLNHLAYEQSTAYDVVEPLEEFYRDSAYKENVRAFYSDIENVPHELKYDRIISIATFEHITDLPTVVAHAALRLKPDGSLRAAFPNEGSVMWKLAYTMSTGIEFRLKYGLNYRKLMAHEHVNTAKEIAEVLEHFFKTTCFRAYGFSRTVALYHFYVCKNPDTEKARRHLGL